MEIKIERIRSTFTAVAKRMRPVFTAVAMHGQLTKPHYRIAASIPLLIIAPVNPLPGDGTLGILFLLTGVSQLYRDMKDRITGIHQEKKDQRLRKNLALLSDTSQRSGHLQIEKKSIPSIELNFVK